MSENNKTVVREVVEQGYNKNQLGIVEETHARDFVVRWVFPGIEEQRGPDAARNIISRLRGALPDMHVSIDKLIAEGDLVAGQWTIEGTHRGEYVSAAGTFPATGNQVKFSGINMFRLSQGKIVEQTISYDRLTLWQQFGGAPETSEILSKVARK